MSRRPKFRRSEDPSPRDFRALYRKLERALREIEATENIAATLERILETLVRDFRDELGFEGGRIYRREQSDYYLCCGFGSSAGSPIGLRVPRDYAPHLTTLRDGLLIMRRGDAGYDEVFERSIGVRSTFAAIAVGRDNRFVIAFSIDGELQEEGVLYLLTALRHVINLKLEQQVFTDAIEESRAIQESMLPPAAPDRPGWDIAGRSRPAETVGGDLFDYLSLADGGQGIAVVDASGHGLPAALMARDAVTGLRMAVDGSLDPARIIERLNRVIHRAALSSKFVSLFYGELAADGRLAYCNAGHNAPLLVRSGSSSELNVGGPVLGPLPRARYEVGTERLVSGDRLVAFTDGLVERESPAGQPFGTERLQEVLSELPDASAEDLLEAVSAAVERHAGGRSAADDATIVVVRKT